MSDVTVTSTAELTPHECPRPSTRPGTTWSRREPEHGCRASWASSPQRHLAACGPPPALQEPHRRHASTPRLSHQPHLPTHPPRPPPPTGTGAREPAQPVSGADMAGHIHNLAYDGRQLLIGTHEGLWGRTRVPRRRRCPIEAFDVMGFTPAADRWLASGHPGAGMDAPADLGLLASTDQGRTWTEVSLGGEVDFHRLVTSGDVVVGLNAHDGRLLRSDDDGATWADLGVPGLYDLAVSPADPSVIVGTTENGPVRSTDSGATFQPDHWRATARAPRMDGRDAVRGRRRRPGVGLGRRRSHLEPLGVPAGSARRTRSHGHHRFCPRGRHRPRVRGRRRVIRPTHHGPRRSLVLQRL